jgi:hypothetical protein
VVRATNAGYLAGGSIVLLILLMSAGCSILTANDSGTIAFGTQYHQVSNSQIDIVNPKTVFHAGEPMAWVAHLSSKAGSHTITFSILRSRGGRQTLVFEQAQPIKDSRFNELANGVMVGWLARLHVTPPGTYIMRYSRGGMKLAEGTFKLTKR